MNSGSKMIVVLSLKAAYFHVKSKVFDSYWPRVEACSPAWHVPRLKVSAIPVGNYGPAFSILGKTSS